MGRKRNGNLELRGSIYVIGEGLTEQYYFLHLKHFKKYNCVVKPRFFGKTSIDEIDKSVKKLLLGGVTVICVFDADVSMRNATEKEKLEQFVENYGKNRDVIICDSLPSIEFWFLLHFVKTNKYFHNSKAVEKELKKEIKDFAKTESFLKNSNWVEQLIRKLETARENAKSIGQFENLSYSNIYRAIEKLEGK